jgi:hypothetical protein
MSRLQDLEVFVQVVNSGNFAKAAAALEINPSAALVLWKISWGCVCSIAQRAASA